MKNNSVVTGLFVLTYSGLCGVESFLCTSASGTLREPSWSVTSLKLLPTQGAQLFADGTSVYDDLVIANSQLTRRDQDSSQDDGHEEYTHFPSTANYEGSFHHRSSRSLVSRFFSLPVSLRHPKEHTIVSQKFKDEETSETDQIVYYPLVGFRLVHPCNEQDGTVMRALPTVANPSCLLHYATHAEPLYGFYSRMP